MKKIKIVIIGAGYIAEEHIKVLKSFTKIEISGIFSRTKKKAEFLAKKYKINLVCNSVEELFNSTHADGVIVAVSVDSVFELTKKIFKYDWISLIEKPAGYNFFEATKIYKLAKKLNRKSYVALNRNYYSSTLQLLSELKNQKSKRVVTIFDQENNIEPMIDGYPAKVTRNWMYANSIHLIDFFRLLARGKCIKVKKIVKYNKNKPYLVIAKLLFSSGDIGIYNAVWNMPGNWSVSVNTQKKFYEMKPIESLVSFNSKREKFYFKKNKFDTFFKPGFKLQIESFLKILKKPKNKSKLPTLEDALFSMKIIKKIYF